MNRFLKFNQTKMEKIIHALIILPIVTFLLSLLISSKKENSLSNLALGFIILQLILSLILFIFWTNQNAIPHNIPEFSVYKNKDYNFYIDFYFDKLTMLFLFFGTFITLLITLYSRYYLHREIGYKRFFNTILFFFAGYIWVIFSGNIETLFIGWEILGISSFLLIAFYRDRYLPVKNAVKVFSIYRIGDIGLILTMWLSHHLWHENISFQKLTNAELVHHNLENHSLVGFSIAFFIFIAAAAKSAQLPFSSWLPRAMEGPTPSSAIFYGSLSVHIGAFLLLRTYPFWEFQNEFKVFLVFAGLSTAVIAHFIAQVQSSIKSQIAYASIAQIGLIFIEIALGFHWLAMFHITGNAFLRTYQLLVSPSIVAHKIKSQLFSPPKKDKRNRLAFLQRVNSAFYLLSLKEFNLDYLMFKWLWSPLKKIGSTWKILSFKYVFYIISSLIIFGIVVLISHVQFIEKIQHSISLLFGIIGLLTVIKSFTERDSVRKSWALIMLNHVLISLSISFNEQYDWVHNAWYLSGILISWLCGLLVINRMRKQENWFSLDRFYGHAYEHPRNALLFLLCCLGISGFPITPSFIGEDLIFSHIHSDQIFLAFCVGLSLIINGLAAIRIYARIFLGPHVKTYHEVAKRSS
jgi:NADH:ubiquinone oxidoreductase subunit 5 (subunit L)/multisubunit Na+/H+ antiporter MnhA subunit